MNRRSILKSIIAAIAAPRTVWAAKTVPKPKVCVVRVPKIEISKDYGKSWVELQAGELEDVQMRPGVIVNFPAAIGDYRRE